MAAVVALSVVGLALVLALHVVRLVLGLGLLLRPVRVGCSAGLRVVLGPLLGVALGDLPGVGLVLRLARVLGELDKPTVGGLVVNLV